MNAVHRPANNVVSSDGSWTEEDASSSSSSSHHHDHHAVLDKEDSRSAKQCRMIQKNNSKKRALASILDTQKEAMPQQQKKRKTTSTTNELRSLLEDQEMFERDRTHAMKRREEKHKNKNQPMMMAGGTESSTTKPNTTIQQRNDNITATKNKPTRSSSPSPVEQLKLAVRDGRRMKSRELRLLMEDHEMFERDHQHQLARRAEKKEEGHLMDSLNINTDASKCAKSRDKAHGSITQAAPHKDNHSFANEKCQQQMRGSMDTNKSKQKQAKLPRVVNSGDKKRVRELLATFAATEKQKALPPCPTTFTNKLENQDSVPKNTIDPQSASIKSPRTSLVSGEEDTSECMDTRKAIKGALRLLTDFRYPTMEERLARVHDWFLHWIRLTNPREGRDEMASTIWKELFARVQLSPGRFGKDLQSSLEAAMIKYSNNREGVPESDFLATRTLPDEALKAISDSVKILKNVGTPLLYRIDQIDDILSAVLDDKIVRGRKLWRKVLQDFAKVTSIEEATKKTIVAAVDNELQRRLGPHLEGPFLPANFQVKEGDVYFWSTREKFRHVYKHEILTQPEDAGPGRKFWIRKSKATEYDTSVLRTKKATHPIVTCLNERSVNDELEKMLASEEENGQKKKYTAVPAPLWHEGPFQLFVLVEQNMNSTCTRNVPIKEEEASGFDV